jgi:hypothetical protein
VAPASEALAYVYAPMPAKAQTAAMPCLSSLRGAAFHGNRYKRRLVSG